MTVKYKLSIELKFILLKVCTKHKFNGEKLGRTVKKILIYFFDNFNLKFLNSKLKLKILIESSSTVKFSTFTLSPRNFNFRWTIFYIRFDSESNISEGEIYIYKIIYFIFWSPATRNWKSIGWRGREKINRCSLLSRSYFLSPPVNSSAKWQINDIFPPSSPEGKLNLLLLI